MLYTSKDVYARVVYAMVEAYQVKPVTNTVMCLMKGVDSQILHNHGFLEKSLKEALARDHFTILGNVFYDFEPHGFSDVELLKESHASIHTYPEFSGLQVILNTCRGRNDGRRVLELFRDMIKPKAFTVCELEADFTFLKFTYQGSWL